MKPAIYIVILSLLLSCCGCAAIDKNLKENKSAVVKYPSKTGEAVGLIIGVPTAIVLLPATLIIGGLIKDEEQSVWLPLAPVAACSDLGAVVFGGIPWLIFGRQENVQPKNESIANTENHEEKVVQSPFDL